MPLKVLIIPDKFKGTLNAAAAAQAIARGWKKGRPQDHIQLQPISDGGDGFGEVLSAAMRAKARKTRTLNAAHQSSLATWWWDNHSRTAIIESARVIGLAMLPPEKFHPFQLDSFGIGALLRAAARKRPARCIVGIGGSATNDGGFGLARALGWQFLDHTGRIIEKWPDLRKLDSIRSPAENRRGRRSQAASFLSYPITVAVDVQNSLLGPRGATTVYGPQKGIRARDIVPAEKCLARLATVCERAFGKDFSRIPGAGAAGGLGFGLLAFLQARLAPGFELIARHTGLGERLRWADLVITGEGSLDQSTLMGKAVGEIAVRCRKLRIPCIGLAGMVAGSRHIRDAFTQAYALTEVVTLEKAKTNPARSLELLAERVAQAQKD